METLKGFSCGVFPIAIDYTLTSMTARKKSSISFSHSHLGGFYDSKETTQLANTTYCGCCRIVFS